MNNGGGGGWANAIAPAATNIANAFLDTEASTADRVAGALGIPALANQWKADTSKGDAYIKDMQNSMDLNSKNYIQDASSSWGGANAVKQNLKTNISPISFNSAVPSLKDFKGNWWKNMGASVAQGAASGSVGGPWGALGGAVTGLFGSIGGLFGRKGRAERAYKDFLAKRKTLVSAQEAAYNRAVTDQTLSNMQALANGNTQQRINDTANIRAYGGNLYPNGGTLDPFKDKESYNKAVNELSSKYTPAGYYDDGTPYYNKESGVPYFPTGYFIVTGKDGEKDRYVPSYTNQFDNGTQSIYESENTFFSKNAAPDIKARLSAQGFLPLVTVRGDKSDFYSPNNINGDPLYQDVQDFYSDWLNRRRDILNDNMGGTFFDKLFKRGLDREYKQQVNDIANTRIEYANDEERARNDNYVKQGVPGYPALAWADARNNKIALFSSYANDEPTILHEMAHRAGVGKPQEREIKSILKDRKGNQINDPYYDNPTEIYSRLMEARWSSYLKPEDKIDKEWIKENKDLLERYHLNYDTDTLLRLFNEVADNNNTNSYNNIAAMGGHLYTDLSPNMMSLWNNKQQIDQQKVNTQQMNFGLGNSFNYKNMFPDGGIIPPNRPLTREELDKLTPAEKEEYAKKQIIRLYKEVAAPSPALHDSREEDDEHTYNVLNRPDQNPYSSFNVFGNLFKPSNSGYIFTERDKRKEAAEKAQQHSGSAGGWGGKLPDEYIDKMINAPDKSWVDYEEEKKNGKKYETPENSTPSANVFDTILSWFRYDNTNKDKIYDENNRFYANGGQLNSSDLPDNAQYYANGGTHEENPYGGIQVGVDQQGNPNLVEEGEFRWGDYIFSDRINVDPTLLSRYNLAPATKHQGKKANKGKLSYADMAKKYAKKNKELANDPIGKNTLDAYMKRLQDAQEDQKFQDSMEQQKQDAINQYRNALTTPQQGNPMYGAMKYNGMGNAATQQGVNAGMSDLGQQSSGNEVLSNTNRSGNNMLHAFGGNLYPIGGWLGRLFGRTQNNQQPSKNEWGINKSLSPWGGEPTFEQRWAHPSVDMPYMPKDLNESLQNIGLGTFDGHIPAYDYYYTPVSNEDNNNLYGNYIKNQYLQNKYLSDMSFGSTMQPAQTQQNIGKLPNGNNFTFEQWRDMQYGNNNSPYMMSRQKETPDAFTLQAQGKIADGSTVDADYTTGYNGTTNTNTSRSSLTGNINTDNTTTGTYATNAFKEDREGIPLYNTSGKLATFGKGFTPMLYDWMNKTNFKYDQNQRPANELVDMGNNSTFLRTADTIGGYRAPNLMDAERMNNAAQAQGLAALQAAFNVGNRNRGFAATQAAQNAYNTQMSIGNNYATAQQANNEERYKTDAFNTAIDQFNANARNTSYQDNQKAEQVGQQMALSAKQAANDYLQKENWYADRTNRTAMDNRATNQAAWTDNALNYFITQAQENAERNRQNNDITKRYWSDKDGVMHYIGDSGLNGKIREYFRKNNIDNGTFTGDRLAAFNSIIQNNKAKDVANEKGELWSTVQGLMDDEIAARNKETADADKAKADELQEYRDQFDSELAQLGRYAANKDIYGNYWTSSGDLDYYGKEGFRDSQSLSQLKRAIEMLRTHNDRYNKWTPQNVTAYGGHINNGNKNNKNGYYTYTY